MVVGSEYIKKFTEGFTEAFYDTKDMLTIFK